MANAVPVMKQEAPKKPEAPKAPPTVPQDEHAQYIGKDHPDFGVWTGSGWRKDN